MPLSRFRAIYLIAALWRVQFHGEILSEVIRGGRRVRSCAVRSRTVETGNCALLYEDDKLRPVQKLIRGK